MWAISQKQTFSILPILDTQWGVKHHGCLKPGSLAFPGRGGQLPLSQKSPIWHVSELRVYGQLFINL